VAALGVKVRVAAGSQLLANGNEHGIRDLLAEGAASLYGMRDRHDAVLRNASERTFDVFLDRF